MHDQQRRSERIALNESRFREINDRLRRDLADLHVSPERIAFVCECGHRVCGEQVSLSPADYERVRADAMLFFVVAGHEILDVEYVVERLDGVNVVRKHDNVSDLAHSTDPRS